MLMPSRGCRSVAMGAHLPELLFTCVMSAPSNWLLYTSANATSQVRHAVLSTCFVSSQVTHRGHVLTFKTFHAQCLCETVDQACLTISTTSLKLKRMPSDTSIAHAFDSVAHAMYTCAHGNHAYKNRTTATSVQMPSMSVMWSHQLSTAAVTLPA